MQIIIKSQSKLGGAPGNALVFLQCGHPGGHVGLGPSPQSVCCYGVRRLHQQVQLSCDVACHMLNLKMTALCEMLRKSPHVISAAFRRCSSYQDFTQIGGSTESVEFPRSPSDGDGLSQKSRHVIRTLSEPSQLSGRRMATERGRRRQR